MSSSFRELSQIENRTRFFLALQSTTYYIPNAGLENEIQSVMKESLFNTVFNDDLAGESPKLFRDMGKSIMVVDDTTGQHLAQFRLVQEQDGPAAEGVPDDLDTYYICTWTADSVEGTYAVTVARAG